MKTLEAISNRHCYRGAYKQEPVPREDLKAIMEAGLAAPSGCNKQSVSLIAVDDPALRARLREAMGAADGETSPAAIIVLSQQIMTPRGIIYARQDYGAAIQNMLLAITELGYASCWYEGLITDKNRLCDRIAAVLDVPEGYDVVCYLPVGVPSEEGTLPAKKPFEERAWFNGFKA